MTLLGDVATAPDLLRLLAVPVFAWVAVRDVRTRRVPNAVWIPLGVLGAATLALEGWLAWRAGGPAWTVEFLVPATIGLGMVVPLAYCFWWFGGFGGADAKALLVLALVFPTAPRYVLAGVELPAVEPLLGAFSFTVLTNAVLVGLAFPLALALRNAAAGRIAPAMVVGRPVPCERIAETHGTLLETTEGRTRNGLDLDALRMYLRWRGLDLTALREDPDRYRDPDSLPAEPNPPTDGAVESGRLLSDGAGNLETPRAEADDPWGAEAFLAAIDGSAYGTSPDQLRAGLEVLAEAETVWVSPGTPFLVPIALGLAIGLLYGDPLAALLR